MPDARIGMPRLFGVFSRRGRCEAGILRWFTSRISNGVLEGINGLVQAARARARGYRNVRNFITMVYLIAGKLDLTSPT